jgi:hypothetical protein
MVYLEAILLQIDAQVADLNIGVRQGDLIKAGVRSATGAVTPAPVPPKPPTL